MMLSVAGKFDCGSAGSAGNRLRSGRFGLRRSPVFKTPVAGYSVRPLSDGVKPGWDAGRPWVRSRSGHWLRKDTLAPRGRITVDGTGIALQCRVWPRAVAVPGHIACPAEIRGQPTTLDRFHGCGCPPLASPFVLSPNAVPDLGNHIGQERQMTDSNAEQGSRRRSTCPWPPSARPGWRSQRRPGSSRSTAAGSAS